MRGARARQEGHAATVRALLRLGADPARRDADGQAPLRLAQLRGHKQAGSPRPAGRGGEGEAACAGG